MRLISALTLALVLGVAQFFAPEVLIPSASARVKDEVLVPEQSEKAKAVKIPVAQLIKKLQLGSEKSWAMAKIAEQLAAGDLEMFAEKDKIVSLLFSIMRNAFDKKLAEEAAVTLASFGVTAIEPLLAELNGATGSTPVSKALAVRALGLIGNPAKEIAGPVLNEMLKTQNRKSMFPQLITEAAIALALMGGPFDPEIIPDIVRGMMQVKDVDSQLKVAFQIIDAHGERTPYTAFELQCLDHVLVKALDGSIEDAKTQADSISALAKIKAPNALSTILKVLSSETYTWEGRSSAADALSGWNPPSRQILESLASALRLGTNPPVVQSIYETLASYGAAAAPVLPTMEAFLKDMLADKHNQYGGNKPWLEKGVKEAMAKIKVATAKQVTVAAVKNPAAAPATNQVAH